MALTDLIDEAFAPAAASTRNGSIPGAVLGLVTANGERAVQWAGEITEPGLREAAQIRAGRHFYAQDQEAATQWFTNSGLPQAAWTKVASKPRQGS